MTLISVTYSYYQLIYVSDDYCQEYANEECPHPHQEILSITWWLINVFGCLNIYAIGSGNVDGIVVYYLLILVLPPIYIDGVAYGVGMFGVTLIDSVTLIAVNILYAVTIHNLLCRL